MRIARELSPTDIYHILMSSVPGEKMFRETEDKEKFLNILLAVKEKTGFDLYGYCLMENHIHLLLRVNEGNPGEIVKQISVSYSVWYNRKYERRGSLYSDRYKSEIIEDDEKFLAILRFIHQNPVKSQLADKPENYKYSSYFAYKSHNDELIDINLVLDFVSDEEFEEYTYEETDEVFLEIKPLPLSFKRAEILFGKISKCNSSEEFTALDDVKKQNIIKKCIREGMSVRQVSLLCGISIYFVNKLRSKS